MDSPSNLDFSLIGLNRRSFLRRSGLLAAMTPAAAYLLGGTADASTLVLPFPPGNQLDIAILNFALNLEFLEAEYYNLGVTGQSITAQGVNVGGAGTPGGVTVKSNPAVPFQTKALQQFMAEIAQDEVNHIKFIQNTITSLGGTPVARPSIDLLNSFNTVASKAGIATTFDPFADEVSFYLGAFSLTDVGVTAYHGAAPFLTNKAVISGSSGILAVEAYHDSTLRLNIFNSGSFAQNAAAKISAFRNSIDDAAMSKDQGVVDANGSANIVPTDVNSIIFARTPRQVLNIVYGGFKAPNGGFFPAGVNGDIK